MNAMSHALDEAVPQTPSPRPERGDTAVGTTAGTNAGRYEAPGWITRHLMNPLVKGLTRCGVSVWGSRVLEVPGRTTGELRRVAVNLLEHDGNHYLVSPRGEGQWVRNVRAAEGRLDLIVGRRRRHWVAVELADSEKEAVLRSYLRRWKAEVGVFFDGVDADSPTEELHRIAPRHPVFLLSPA
jgi:deazaflavin-dependent oxidoreductase (nitroreductase family)